MPDGYVEKRLEEWSKWSWMKIDGAPRRIRQFDYEEWSPACTVPASLSTLPIHLRCLETEEAVAWLRAVNPRAGNAIVTHYRDKVTWSCSMQAEFLRISERSLFRHLQQGCEQLLGYFNDRAAGKQLPQLEALRKRPASNEARYEKADDGVA